MVEHKGGKRMKKQELKEETREETTIQKDILQQQCENRHNVVFAEEALSTLTIRTLKHFKDY